MVDKCIPDVLGYKLEDALVMLQGVSSRVETVMTRPYPDAEPLGEARVVRVAAGDGLIKLIVASQQYLKGGAL